MGIFSSALTRACNRGHAALDSVLKRKRTDFQPNGRRSRDTDYGPDCSCGCRFFIEVREPFSGDWGVCVNPESPRAGLLTFEHQGCKAFKSGDSPGSRWLLRRIKEQQAARKRTKESRGVEA